MSVVHKKNQASKLLKLIPVFFIFFCIGLTVIFVIWLKNWVADTDSAPPKRVQKITIIAPPPPPPQEKPPEPEVEEEIEQPEEELVEDMSDDTAEPAADLGIDADGGAGSDGFGLMGRKGGRGLLDGSPFAYYEGLMVSEIQDLLAELDDLKSKEYKFRIKIKITFDGSVESIKLVKSTGDKEKDKKLLSALRSFDRFSQMPPGKMPPIVDLRITSSI